MSQQAHRIRSRKLKRLCQSCFERPATYQRPSGGLSADKAHDLCQACWTSLRDSQRPVRPRLPDIVVTISQGSRTETVRLRSTLPWKLQNKHVLTLLHSLRTAAAEPTAQPSPSPAHE